MSAQLIADALGLVADGGPVVAVCAAAATLATGAIVSTTRSRRRWLDAHHVVVARLKAERSRKKPVQKSEAPGSTAVATTTDSSAHEPLSSAAALEPYRSDSAAKVAVDARFFKQLMYLVRIAAGRRRTRIIVIMHTAFLVLRTYLSVVVARIDGMLVRDMIAVDPHSFARSLGYWFLIAVPATFTNSMIKYLQSKLAFSLRTTLTQHIHKIYMEKRTYYKAAHLDNRIDGADQLITTDVTRFCNALASLYSNLGKPVLDLIIFNYQLGRNVGLAGTVALFVNYCFTASLIRAFTPSFGKMAAQEAKLEGDFRTAHTRLITNAEEIAFYHGGELERSILDRTYLALIKHINSIYNIRIAYNMFEDMIIKYAWSAVGLMIASVPVFFPHLAGAKTKRIEAAISETSASLAKDSSLSASDIAMETLKRQTGSRTQSFITTKMLMISLADAGGRLMYSYKELSELAGYTLRVYSLVRVLDDLHENRYVRTGAEGNAYSLESINGVIKHEKDLIRFESCPIVTPNGDTLLVKDLSLNIAPGEHLMITGPNGSGKTSVARVLAGLWPLFTGILTAPPAGDIFFIPQRPYLPTGSLRDQIIYPHSVAEMRRNGRDDAELIKVLNLVYLEYLVEREGGFDVVKEWKDVFSGGEKQRVQLARLFYHNPRFAVLDEATSAVSNDVEALLYAAAKELGITVITISHRPTLFKYHTSLLRIGEGPNSDAWTLERLGGDGGQRRAWEGLEKEIARIEEDLRGVDALRKRLAVVNGELGLSETGRAKGAGGAVQGAKRTLV